MNATCALENKNPI